MVTNVKYSSEILNMYYFKYLDDIPEMLFILTFLIKCSVWTYCIPEICRKRFQIENVKSENKRCVCVCIYTGVFK